MVCGLKNCIKRETMWVGVMCYVLLGTLVRCGGTRKSLPDDTGVGNILVWEVEGKLLNSIPRAGDEPAPDDLGRARVDTRGKTGSRNIVRRGLLSSGATTPAEVLPGIVLITLACLLLTIILTWCCRKLNSTYVSPVHPTAQVSTSNVEIVEEKEAKEVEVYE